LEGVWIGFGIFMFLNGIIWIAMFMDLMSMPDDAFPGRFDKPLWVVAFVCLFVLIAPMAFGLWKDRNRKRLRALRQAQMPTPGSER
jgi:hypothetical protein